MEQFEETIHQDLYSYLLSLKEIDERLPECPDIEEKWEQILKAYLPDGIKEFNNYPTASLGWMMYIGMAIASFCVLVTTVARLLPSPFTCQLPSGRRVTC